MLDDREATDNDITGAEPVQFAAEELQVSGEWWARNFFFAASIMCFHSHASASSNVLNRYTPFGKGSFRPRLRNRPVSRSSASAGVRRRILPTTLPGVSSRLTIGSII